MLLSMMTTEPSCQIATNIKDVKKTFSTSSKEELFLQGSLLPTWSTRLRAHSKIPMSKLYMHHLHQSWNYRCPNSQRLLRCRLPIENRCGSAKPLLQSLAGWAFMGSMVEGEAEWWTCCTSNIVQYLQYIASWKRCVCYGDSISLKPILE